MTRAILSGTDEDRIKRFVTRVKHFHRAIIDTLALLTSSAETGSSAMMKAGLTASARAIPMR